MLVVINSILSIGQDRNVQTKIAAENIFELSIIQVYPDSFPNVSVVFQAKNEFGKPLWLLKKSELKISENDFTCDVIKLINITENKPINIGLIFDHSGSMLENPEIKRKKMDEINELYFSGLPIPNDFVSSLDYAKEGILEFLSNSDNSSDSILFVGFSETVDKVFPLTKDVRGIRKLMNGIESEGSTAFYDAIYLALDSLSSHSSNSAIIAMTDGQDNSSTHTYDDVIRKAKNNEIPIYIIGLGDVDKRGLKRMCKLTNGFFYQTNDPNKLKEIYASIKEQLQSIYQVDYTSNCTDLEFDDRTIKFSFINDTLTFSNNTERYKLPKEALHYLQNQEELRLSKIEKERQEKENLALILGGVALLGFASFIVYIRKKKNSITLENVFPNPFENELTISYSLPINTINPTLMIHNINGQKIKTISIDKTTNEMKIDTIDLNRGVYIIKIEDGNNNSTSFKIVKK
jgi:Ca-activated chloride channel homolog